jgi:hypothetical protein
MVLVVLVLVVLAVLVVLVEVVVQLVVQMVLVVLQIPTKLPMNRPMQIPIKTPMKRKKTRMELLRRMEFAKQVLLATFEFDVLPQSLPVYILRELLSACDFQSPLFFIFSALPTANAKEPVV